LRGQLSLSAGHRSGKQREEATIIVLYIAGAIVMTIGSLYFAWQSRDFRKFLAGAFFVSSGILFYLYLADVSVPLLGQVLSKHPRSAVLAQSSISSSSCYAHILASGSQSHSRIPSNNLQPARKTALMSLIGPNADRRFSISDSWCSARAHHPTTVAPIVPSIE